MVPPLTMVSVSKYQNYSRDTQCPAGYQYEPKRDICIHSPCPVGSHYQEGFWEQDFYHAPACIYDVVGGNVIVPVYGGQKNFTGQVVQYKNYIALGVVGVIGFAALWWWISS